MAVHYFGIRHHGPGSALHLKQALERLKPDIVLIEGPPEGEALLEWVNHKEMEPPVALLAYVPDEPQNASFYPFTFFSPEWQAILYGLENGIPIRFIDMPMTHVLAPKEEGPIREERGLDRNPMDYLAEIDGYEDGEEWWEQHFELSQHPAEVFEAVETAMTALRSELTVSERLNEQRREAFMRNAIRKAEKEMYHDIAVVCGAWHVPGLKTKVTQKHDNDLVKKLPKVKVACTWIPWTNDRLSFQSGYGAGINSPGWYGHHWEHPNDDGSLWLSHAAQVFRKQKMDIASSHVIESVRLANALAGLRSRSRPGLKELNEATQTVMCMGDGILMDLVWRDLIVGKRMGSIPEGAPQVPIQRDLEQQARSFRMKFSEDPKVLKLDLREDKQLAKSVFLHRLNLIEVYWGRPSRTSGKGTFKEEWELQWGPEQTLQLLDKAIWGNTVEMACNRYIAHKANTSDRLDEITQLVEKALPAELQEGIEVLMQRMDSLAASTTDTEVLMKAIVPLVQVQRYGNVRKTDAQTVSGLIQSTFYRVVAGLPMACTGIDTEQAQALGATLRNLHRAILLLDQDTLLEDWLNCLVKLVEGNTIAAMIHGTACKLLYDQQALDGEQTASLFSQALSVGATANETAEWLEGFLQNAATTLILDDAIWDIVNSWVQDLDKEEFQNVTPLLRRTFSEYSSSEKIKIAERARQQKKEKALESAEALFNHERAAKVLPVLEQLMGLNQTQG